MAKTKGETKHFRVNEDLENAITAYCAKHKIQNRTDFYTYAITQTLYPDIEDHDLVFSSLKQLHDSMNTVIKQQEILFSFIGFFARYFLSYHQEIPAEFKETAGKSACDRYERAFKSFQENLADTPAMFESLLADYFEEH